MAPGAIIPGAALLEAPVVTLVLVHGIGGASWQGLRLPGVDLLDWPMPGYAGSPALPETTFPALSLALLAALDARGLDRADLLGHSMGGMVALDFALTFPARVRHLILYGTTPAFGGRDPSFAEAFLKAHLEPLDRGGSMASVAPAMLGGMLSAETDPADRAAAIAAHAAVPEATYRAALRCLTTFDRRADLPSLAVPTFLIAGERDMAAPPKTMQRMADAIPGAGITVIPGAGHFAHLERPAEFAAAVRAALAG
jgi:pimeloyl-ACP methyl ester carboxylesterase